MESEILAKVIRGETVESLHRGHLIIVDGDGREIFKLGNPETVTFWRSASKSFQAMPFITSGGAAHFDFSDEEIALACGSHSGEEIHIKTAAGMLEKIGLNETDLQCGAHFPFDSNATGAMVERGEKPTQLHNNCSGKHSAMLAFAKHLDADLKTYLAIENPVQKEILRTVSEFTETPENEIAIGTDGCSAPNFAISLRAMARAFAKLVNPPESFDEKTKQACQRIVSATLRFPEMIGGSERLDTEIMQSANGKIISKVGADGVYSAGVLPSEKWKSGLGIAFKIEDGDDKKARPVVAIELLRQLGILSEEDLRKYFADADKKQTRRYYRRNYYGNKNQIIMSKATKQQDQPPKLRKTADGDIDINSLADLLEWFLNYDARVALVRHPHVEEFFNGSSRAMRQTVWRFTRLKMPKPDLPSVFFRRSVKTILKTELNHWISEVLQTFGEVKQTNEDIAAAYNLEQDQSHIEQAEKIPIKS